MATQVVEKFYAYKKVDDSQLFLKRLTSSTPRQLFEELWKNPPDHGEGLMRFHFGKNDRGKFLEVFNPVKTTDFTDFEAFFVKTFASYGHISQTQFGEGTTTFMLRSSEIGFGDLFITSLSIPTHKDDKGNVYFLGIDWEKCSHCSMEFVIENHPEWLEKLSDTEKKAKYVKNPLFKGARIDGFMVRIYLHEGDEQIAREALADLTFAKGKFQVFEGDTEVTKMAEINLDILTKDSFYDEKIRDYVRFYYQIEANLEESDGEVHFFWLNGKRNFMQKLAFSIKSETVRGAIYITNITMFANETRIEISKSGMKCVEELIKKQKETISGEALRLVKTKKEYETIAKQTAEFMHDLFKIPIKKVREKLFCEKKIEDKAKELIKITNFCHTIKQFRSASAKLDTIMAKIAMPAEFVDPLHESPKIVEYRSEFNGISRKLEIDWAKHYPDMVLGLIIDNGNIVGELFLGDAIALGVINVANGWHLSIWKARTWKVPFPFLLENEIGSDTGMLRFFFDSGKISEIGESDLPKFVTTKTEIQKTVKFDHIDALNGFMVENDTTIPTPVPKEPAPVDDEAQPSDADDDPVIEVTPESKPISPEPIPEAKPEIAPEPVKVPETKPEPPKETPKPPETMDLSKISYAKTKAMGKKAPKDVTKIVYEGMTYPIGVIYDATFFNAKIPILFESEKQYNGYYELEGRKVSFRGKIRFRDYLAFRMAVQKVIKELGWSAKICPLFTWQPEANFTSFVNRSGILCLNIAKCPNFAGKGASNRRTFWFIIRIARALAKYQYPYSTQNFDTMMTDLMDTMIAHKIVDTIQEIFGMTNEALKTLADANETKYGETEDETEAILLPDSYKLELKIKKDDLVNIDTFGTICKYEYDGFETLEREYGALVKGAMVTVRYKNGTVKKYVYTEVWEEVE